MKQVVCRIKGLVPGLLMHRFSMEEQAKIAVGGGAVGAVPKAAEEAEKGAYRIPPGNPGEGNLFIPAENVRQALVAAASYEKGKGRGTLAKFAAAAIFVGPTEYLDLGVKVFEIDSRPVVVPATKGRVIRHRPKLKEWEIQFTIEYDDMLLREEQLRRVVDHCGSKVGIGDFRPAKRGPHGRFTVVKWEAQN